MNSVSPKQRAAMFAVIVIGAGVCWYLVRYEHNYWSIGLLCTIAVAFALVSRIPERYSASFGMAAFGAFGAFGHMSHSKFMGVLFALCFVTGLLLAWAEYREGRNREDHAVLGDSQ